MRSAAARGAASRVEHIDMGRFSPPIFHLTAMAVSAVASKGLPLSRSCKPSSKMVRINVVDPLIVSDHQSANAPDLIR